MYYIWAREGAKRLWNRDFDYSLSDREKVLYRQAVYGIPFFGSALEAHDRGKYWDDYLRNRGMTWSDVKYPFNLDTGVTSITRQGMNYVSSNIKRLYK